MSETQVLLSRIVALRQRLEQARGLACEAGAVATGLLDDPAGPARLRVLERRAVEGGELARQLDAVRPPHPATGETVSPLPAQLTARARRALERARDLLGALRGLAGEAAVHEAGSVAAALHREATAMTDTAVRLVQGLPDSPSAQLQQCEGIEGVLQAVAGKLASLTEVVRRQREESSRIELLADFLLRLEAGSPTNLVPLSALVETLLEEAAEGAPLRFLHPPVPVLADSTWVARCVACHGLTVAQVMAGLVRHDPELRGRSSEAVLAALLHDVGMLRVPAALLAHAGPLDAEGRRAVEAHCHAGAALLERLLPDATHLAEAAAHHHERCDGTGYPDGLREAQVTPLTRLLAVCDIYAAVGCRRPCRPPRETRTALTDVLLLAEQGALDSHFAERLLQLSFYPAGSVVEMADGAVGLVVAAPCGRHDLNAPARPVVALLLDADNHFLAAPRFVDLVHSDSHSIVRSLTAVERRRLLGGRYPEWAA